ncbi:MAG: hypothetical protein J5930_08485 [Treponema sp.]|nr:hypothetical protein [Treponema sp.]
MKSNEALEKVLNSYRGYYNIKTEGVESPFAAEAEFHSHNEKFLLVKAARIADIDSNEYVFFALENHLTFERLKELDRIAWERGISRVKPDENHRNSDVILYVLADSVDGDVPGQIKKLKHYKSYLFSLRGWSHYRLLAYDCSSKKALCNRMGKDLRKVVAKL